MGSSQTDIWYLISNLEIGGAERTLVDLVNRLDPDQFNITIWTLTEPGPLATDVQKHVAVRSLGAKNKGDIRAPLQFMSEIKNERPSILQSFLFYDNTLATIAGLMSPRTTVITGVRAVPDNPSTFRNYIRHVSCRLADHIVSNSEAGAKFILDYGVPPERVSVVRNGRNIDVYRSGESTPELRRSLGIPRDVPVVGTVGRLVERKGHYDLLKAWPAILNEYPDAHLLIVGEGPERDGLETIAGELSIQDSIHLPGTQDNIPDMLDLMDVFVFPSHFEGLPGALIEAMIAGLPIIATPVDGNSELIDDEITGLFVPVKDDKKISEYVVNLLSDPETRNRLGTAANEQAKEEFSIKTMATEFSNLYDELIEADPV